MLGLKNFLAPEGRSEMGQAVMLGTQFAVGMAVFSFLGWFVDQKRGDGAILFTLLGMVAGLAYGGYEVWKVVRMLNAKARDVCIERGAKPPEAQNEPGKAPPEQAPPAPPDSGE